MNRSIQFVKPLFDIFSEKNPFQTRHICKLFCTFLLKQDHTTKTMSSLKKPYFVDGILPSTNRIKGSRVICCHNNHSDIAPIKNIIEYINNML